MTFSILSYGEIYALDIFLHNNTNLKQYCFPLLLQVLSHIRKVYKKLTINLAHFASGLPSHGIVLHIEKGCSESWNSHSQQTLRPRPRSMTQIHTRIENFLILYHINFGLMHIKIILMCGKLF